METVLKMVLFGLVGIVVLALIGPGFGQAFTRLFTRSETIIVPSARTPAQARAAAQDGLPANGREVKLVTLLGYDAIQAILDPPLVAAEEADAWMEPDEQVLGVSINGDERAYSVRMLSRHEIVNDVVGGVPVAATW